MPHRVNSDEVISTAMAQVEMLHNSNTLINGELEQLIKRPAQEPQEEKVGVKKCKTQGVNKMDEDTTEGSESGSSGPPSPPSSGRTTPRLTIAPCPDRLRELIPPNNYGTVDHHAIYRSAYPEDRNIAFVKSLKIRSVLTLVDTAPSAGFQQWMDRFNIKQAKVEIAKNKFGNVKTTMDSICEAVLFLMDSANHPVHVHCNRGKHRTGCVIACLRKVQRMSAEEAMQEYITYSSSKERDGDKTLINSFEPDLVFEYAKKHGYLKYLGPDITNINTLAATLSAVRPINVASHSDSKFGTTNASPTLKASGDVFMSCINNSTSFNDSGLHSGHFDVDLIMEDPLTEGQEYDVGADIIEYDTGLRCAAPNGGMAAFGNGSMSAVLQDNRCYFASPVIAPQ